MYIKLKFDEDPNENNIVRLYVSHYYCAQHRLYIFILVINLAISFDTGDMLKLTLHINRFSIKKFHFIL